jgi:putative PIN family toxin of toxin-antitoxin system
MEQSLCEHSLSALGLPVVLDTNAAFDWLLFDDRRMRPIASAILSGQLQWIAAASMRDEYVHVLHRGLARSRGEDADTLVAAWDRHTRIVDAPPAQALQCADPDDQRFIDLAVACQARWLFTRDKALLGLARRAIAQGVRILPPAEWPGLDEHGG